ncbi:MAG TPA: cytochrome B6, partial [Acidimicrobiales bacterium]|nr:cytochrome B6 [Acidimicrobiales bacterium]
MSTKRFNPDRDVPEWAGPTARYDILKEVTVCFVVVVLLTVALAVVFGSPDDAPVTLKSWSSADPTDFVQTAITELAGTSATATYGPPYNSTAGASQKLGPISLENLSGVHIPLDTTKDFVIDPLLTLPAAPALDAAISRYQAASSTQQQNWDNAYTTASAKATFSGGVLKMPAGDYGPVSVMMTELLAMARSGALDGALLATHQLYDTDYTKPLLFIADGTYMATLAADRHLQGSQWGMMNETGNYP